MEHLGWEHAGWFVFIIGFVLMLGNALFILFPKLRPVPPKQSFGDFVLGGILTTLGCLLINIYIFFFVLIATLVLSCWLSKKCTPSSS